MNRFVLDCEYKDKRLKSIRATPSKKIAKRDARRKKARELGERKVLQHLEERHLIRD
ncbi:MAG: hypothetical protein LBP89_07625 [Helicobacteraceae bacterium]|nr:hypothetical protein [Helicobacteraceae bacterium]